MEEIHAVNRSDTAVKEVCDTGRHWWGHTSETFGVIHALTSYCYTNNLNDSHKYYVEQKKLDTKLYYRIVLFMLS